MALIKCVSCGKEISDRAKICPNCGTEVFTDITAEAIEEVVATEPETIHCPECGTEVSAETEICPNCGYPISEDKVKESEEEKKQTEDNEKENNDIRNFIKNNKKIVAVAVAVVAILAIIIYNIGGGTLSGTEKYALSKVERYQNMMKDPDSFKLRNDVLVIVAKEDDGRNTYTYITASGNNSYGASITSTAMFKNYSYIGDYEDDYEDFDTNAEKLEFLTAKKYLLAWNLAGENGEDNWVSAELVSGKKIAKKLHIEYVG